MSKSLKDFLKLRMPNGDLYERRKKAKMLLDYAKKDENRKLLPFAEYLYASTSDVYYKGGKHYAHSLSLMDEILDIQNGMIMMGKLQIPKPDFKELFLFEYEFYDLLMPYLITKYDDRYNIFYHEGPYELNSEVSVKERDIVIDCGANMGFFSAIASERAPLGKVYAFEPSSAVIEKYLKQTAKYRENISIERVALSDICGEMNMAIDNNNIGASSIIMTDEKVMYEKVEITTLDQFVEENKLPYVSYIKADIEGAERNMLSGATRVLKEFAPKISICTYHLSDDPEVLERIIKSANSNYVIKHEYKKLYAYCP